MKNLIDSPVFAAATFFLLSISIACAQAPVIEWQKSLGGSSNDHAYSIQTTADGGYIVAGLSSSNDGDVIGNHGIIDFLVLKLSSNGDIEWQKSLGGSNDDHAYSIQTTADGGYIVAGSSLSNNGDVSGNHGNIDCLVLKLSANGDIEWQKSLGGSFTDYAYSVQTTADGGYVLAGVSLSNNGDVSGNHGNSDYWILKLSSNGDIEWQKSLGGSGDDLSNSIQTTADGGYIVAGYSVSNNGDVSGNHGNSDYWILKLSSNGDIEWQKSLGGTGYDLAFSIQTTLDGGYVVAGFSSSNDGDVTGNHGNYDGWVLKLGSDGDIEWQKSLGGSGDDFLYSIQTTADGGYAAAGYSNSNDGDVSGNHGTEDFWVLKLSSSGIIEWQKSLGGRKEDAASSIQTTADGGYVVAGYSASIGGDLSSNQGGFDYWIVKLAPTTPTNEVLAAPPQLSTFPNPTTGRLSISLTGQQMIASFTLSDLTGKMLQEQQFGSPEQQIEIDLCAIPKGVYLLQVQSQEQVFAKKVVVD